MSNPALKRTTFGRRLASSLGASMSLVELAGTVALGLSAFMFGEAVVGIIGYLFIAVVSLGFVHGESASDANTPYPWHGLKRSSTGRWVVEAQVATFIGAVVVVVAIAAYVAWRVSSAASHA